jgi:hypothetical protein
MINPLTRPLFVLHDSDPTSSGMLPIPREKAAEWNKRGYGVHWAVNEYKDLRREENVTKINSWFYEVDDLPKSHQLLLIESGLYPSMVVESKNSYHVYFFANNATKESFREIQARLVYHYGSDDKLIHPACTLRAPGFNHMKDPTDPFPVEVVWYKPEINYTSDAMLYFFSEVPKKEEPQLRIRDTIRTEDLNYFDKLYNLNHVEALRAFSGTSWVNGEVYTFKSNRNGKYNIVVNNKGTSCFVDQHGRIGARGGGPTIYQWLRWYNHAPIDIKKATKEVLGC